jgi:hypothetical protein
MTNFRLSVLAATAMLLSACATGPAYTPVPVAPAVDAEKARLQADLAAARAEQARLSEKVSALQAEVNAPAPVPAPAPAPAPSTDGYPANAKAGECYARVVNPPIFKSVSEKVLAKAATETVEIIPARFEEVEEKVLVKPASKKVVEVIPAVYRMVEEKVLVKAASERLETIPATYKVVEEKELVKPATTIWKKGRGPIEKVDNISGDIMCLVEVPAEYRVIKKTVVDTPAEVKRIPIPAEYAVIKRQELVKAAELKEADVPAEYKVVKVRKQAAAAEEKRIPVPAVYQEVTRELLVSEGSSEWKSILCETNTTVGVVQDIQRALLAKGFNPGPIDGVIGSETTAAMNAFQKANNLATGGITFETLSKLGVSTGR